jgi:tetratricopeptide (TPR) repeat protein
MIENLFRAELLIRQERYQQAEGELRLFLASDPENGYAHALLALCQLEQNNLPEAEASARQAISLAPDRLMGHRVLGMVLLRRNRTTEAAQAVDEALRVEPANADLFALKSIVALQRSRWQEALGAAREGLEHEPDNLDCINLQAQALIKLGRKDEAAHAIGGALAQAPDDSFTHANQGWALLHEGKPKQALEHFRESLRLDPENEFARAGMVEALKARNVIYRVMLSFFLWMSRLPPKFQWLVILGGFFGIRFLSNAASSMPTIKPFVLPIIVIYVIFAVMTWVADPLFNLLLQINRFGRHALSQDQRVGSIAFGITLAIALFGGAGFLGFWFLGIPAFVLFPFIAVGVVFGLALIPVSAIWKCDKGWPRWGMGIYTAGLIALGLFTFTVGIFLGSPHFRNLLSLFGMGVLLSEFIGIALMRVNVRR